MADRISLYFNHAFLLSGSPHHYLKRLRTLAHYTWKNTLTVIKVVTKMTSLARRYRNNK